jgi:outer membrane protein TolC
LSVGFSAGGFGGGSNRTAAGIPTANGQVQVSPSFGNFDTRTDFDVFAVWTLQNAGAGNRASTHRAQAVVGEARAALDQTTNQVRREIAEALADVLAAGRQIEITRSQLCLAEEGFSEEMERIKKSVGRPLETLDSFRQLSDAQQAVLRAVVVYNAAQYRLLVVIGWSPLTISLKPGR